MVRSEGVLGLLSLPGCGPQRDRTPTQWLGVPTERAWELPPPPAPPPPLTLALSCPRHRMPREQWWLNLRLMLKMLAHYRISMADYVSGELEHVTRRTLSIETGF